MRCRHKTEAYVDRRGESYKNIKTDYSSRVAELQRVASDVERQVQILTFLQGMPRLKLSSTMSGCRRESVDS